MRRLLPILALLLALPSCAPSPEGPTAPIAEEQFIAGFGLDVAGARQSVVDFLNAYADASRDGAAALARLVGGPKLIEWVRWLNVQNREFEGTISGSVDLRSVEFAASAPIQGTIGAEIDLGASVTFSFVPADGEPFQRTRILDGPITVVRAGTADWRVLDLTRDGISMDQGIQLFEKLQQENHGVSVRVASLFQFVPNWQFNVVVENRSGRDIVLDPSSPALYVRRPGGGFERTPGVITRSIVGVPGGASAEGLVAFPMQASARGTILSIPYRMAGGRLARFDFPLGGLVSPVPAPQTGGATAPGAPS